MPDQDTLDRFVAKRAGDDLLTKQEQAEINDQAKELKDVNVNLAYARMAVSVMKQRVSMVANADEPSDTSAEGIYRVLMDEADAQLQQDLAWGTSSADLDWAEERYKAAEARAEAASRAAWDKADQCVYGDLRETADSKRIAQAGGVQNLNDIQTLATLADDKHCGNCGELSASAFMYLYHLGVRPLDYMVLKPPADHAFVVIGRPGSPRDDEFGRNWGKTAVVCDPWGARVIIPLRAGVQGPVNTYGDSYAAYAATLLEQNMKRMHPSFSGVSLAHRET
jgi:hypothetical protein